MRECPWCGRNNLNVYAYCQSCGRGFNAPPEVTAASEKKRSFWPFGRKAA